MLNKYNISIGLLCSNTSRQPRRSFVRQLQSFLDVLQGIIRRISCWMTPLVFSLPVYRWLLSFLLSSICPLLFWRITSALIGDSSLHNLNCTSGGRIQWCISVAVLQHTVPVYLLIVCGVLTSKCDIATRIPVIVLIIITVNEKQRQ